MTGTNATGATVLCMANQSGGTGKTTTATALGTVFAMKGYRVLVVDLDAQCDTSRILGYDNPQLICEYCKQEFEADRRGRPVGECEASATGHEQQPTIYDALFNEGFEFRESIVPALAWGEEPIDNLSVALASRELASADINLINMPGGDFAVANALATVKDQYDVILIDCPGSLGKLMVSILVASDYVIACVKPGLKEIRALTELEHTINTVNRVVHGGTEKLQLGGVVITDLAQQGKVYTESTELVKGIYGDRALTPIARSVRVPEAYANQVPIVLYDPGSPPAKLYAVVAQELEALKIIQPLGRAVPEPVLQ